MLLRPRNYFSNIRSLAEPAVRFYDKVYLGPFSPAETAEYVAAIFTTAANRAEFAQWLYSKTGGRPYFMAFICRQLAGLARGQLLRPLARSDHEEISVQQFDERYERVYFSRLTDKGLPMRTGRGRYKLYHPLFRLFLMAGNVRLAAANTKAQKDRIHGGPPFASPRPPAVSTTMCGRLERAARTAACTAAQQDAQMRLGCSAPSVYGLAASLGFSRCQESFADFDSDLGLTTWPTTIQPGCG